MGISYINDRLSFTQVRLDPRCIDRGIQRGRNSLNSEKLIHLISEDRNIMKGERMNPKLVN